MKKGIMFATLLVFVFSIFLMFSSMTFTVRAAYTPPVNNRIKFNFDYDWKFIKQDIVGAESVSFNDSAWQDVSLPHTYNDIDHYDTWVTSAGDYGYMGKAWYRKHFKVDSGYSGRKVFLEFEGIRQAGEFYINGIWIGRHENGVGPCGLDITNYINFGTDNVLAVQVNNSLGYQEVATGTSFQGDCPNFNPMYGGIVKNVYLHITDKVYQTFPLYSGLGTSGTYVYATNIDIRNKSANITALFEVKNDNSTSQSVSYQVDFVDKDGNTLMTRTGGAQTVNAGQKTTFSLTGNLSNAHFWSPDYPYLYTVYTTLKVNGTTVDLTPIPFGIRKVSFNVANGLMLNEIPIYLKGFAPRTTMEWPCVGQGVNWMEEYDIKMIKECNGNFIRPMHVGPKKADVDAADKFGIIYVCPANDTELDATGRQWDQRVELMRDLTIYYRNHPSILIYEAGNGGISYDHMTQMLAVRNQWDPYGGRLSGDRTPPADTKTICEYWASMDVPATSNLVPVFDAEYSRTECPRRVWDKYSPPSYGYRNIANLSNTIDDYPNDSFKLNSSEDLARMNIKKYNDRWSKRGGQGLNEVMVGGAKIIFGDSISHGRMIDTEVARVSGAVDAARLPKETYYAMQVVHNPNPQVHILGHWNYPAGTVKNMYVVSSCQQVKLLTYDTNGNLMKDYGYGTRANTFEFGFSNVAWQSGKVKAIGYNGGVQVAQHEMITAGAPSKLKLTPIIGPEGFRADGSDIAMFDVEVVDGNGNRCPTDEARVDFTYSGQGRFLGGYNSGIQNSIFQNYLNTECGINRVFVRSTRTAGNFTLTASRSGLQSASVTISSTAFTVSNGLTQTMPQVYQVTLGGEPTPPPPATPTPTPGGATATPTPTPVANDVMVDFAYTGTHGSSLTPPQPDAHVVHNAQSGMQVYVDSSCTFPALPSYLAGGDYVQAFLRDAADNSSTDLYQFAANRYCYFYQLIDAANQMPNHQNNANYGWTKLADTIVINGRTHNIYKSRLMAPGELGYFASNGYGITLSPNCNLYVVFAVSAEHELQNPSQTVTASSVQIGNNENYAIDGNNATRWGAVDATFPQWIKIDLGRKYSLGGYEINWYNNAGRSYKYKIELSDDDLTYNLSIDRQNNTTQGITTDRTNSINCRAGRFVKITVTGSSAGWASISEIKISGVDSGSSPTPTSTSTPTPTIKPTSTPTLTPTSTPTPTGAPPTPTPTGTTMLLSQGKTATASSYQVGNEVVKGNDGNLTTRWTAVDGTFPQWWKVDLGVSYRLNRVDINWYNGATRSFKYKIEVSTDNVTFTTVIDKTGNTITGDTSDSFAGTGRYVRITITGSSYGWASAYEFKVYGN